MSSQNSVDEVTCERVGVDSFFYGLQKCCFMNGTTTINSTETEISFASDASMGIVLFQFNKEIEFLPKKMFKTFPGLIEIVASYCSITAVFRENFVNLRKLKSIGLQGNLITELSDDTFERSGLESLEFIGLGILAKFTLRVISFNNFCLNFR